MSENTVQLSLGREKVKDDLRTLLVDVEELLRVSASASGEGLDALRSRVRQQVDTMGSQLSDAHRSARSQCKAAMDNANEYVNDNPWRAIGIGVGVGMILGVIAAR